MTNSIVNDSSFLRENVFKIGNFIELRCGIKFEISEKITHYELSDTIRHYITAVELNKNNLKKKYGREITKKSWDEQCYYGCSSEFDVVKVYDKDMNLLQQR